MRDINDVLRKKEADLQQLQREVEALRVAARLLSDEIDSATTYARPSPGNSYASPTRPAPPIPAGAPDTGYGAPWDAAAKKFP